jgi:hypothetical protein
MLAHIRTIKQRQRVILCNFIAVTNDKGSART